MEDVGDYLWIGFKYFFLITFTNLLLISIYRETVVFLAKQKRKSQQKLPDKPFLKKNRKKLLKALSQ